VGVVPRSEERYMAADWLAAIAAAVSAVVSTITVTLQVLSERRTSAGDDVAMKQAVFESVKDKVPGADIALQEVLRSVRSGRLGECKVVIVHEALTYELTIVERNSQYFVTGVATVSPPSG